MNPKRVKKWGEFIYPVCLFSCMIFVCYIAITRRTTECCHIGKWRIQRDFNWRVSNYLTKCSLVRGQLINIHENETLLANSPTVQCSDTEWVPGVPMMSKQRLPKVNVLCKNKKKRNIYHWKHFPYIKLGVWDAHWTGLLPSIPFFVM